MINVLFICTGNTCRSPMAEAILRNHAVQNGLAVAVRSAGVSTYDGLPISAHALSTLRKRDIEHTGSSKAMTSEAMDWADLVLTMTSGHKRNVLHYYPGALDKIYTLKEYVYQDDEEMVDTIAELEKLYTEMQMKNALGQQLTAEERQRLLELEQSIPSFDIADPFGGSQSDYDSCSHEIEEAIRRLLKKLSSDEG